MTLTNIFYLHEIGAKKNQEDYIWPVPGTASPEDGIFIVCDGVGGSDNGEVASKIVAESVGRALLKSIPQDISADFVNQLLQEAMQKLVEYARLHQLETNMATTFTLLMFVEQKAFVCWCGDSRVYHFRDGEIMFRTADHSLVSSLVRNGEITEEEARIHPQKNMILKAVRADETDPEAEGHWISPVLPGDYFLLCTDGLLENIDEKDIQSLLDQNDKGQIDLVRSIQQFCYEKTKDNYSMYLVRTGDDRKAVTIDAIAGRRPERTDQKSGSYKRKVLWLAVLLVVLTVAAAFIIRENYFTPKKKIDIVVPVTINTDSADATDSAKQVAPAHSAKIN